jgi:hypothetical protein
MSGSDPWASFVQPPQTGGADPWAAFVQSAPAPQRPAPRQSNPIGYADNLARQFFQGATFGLRDEAGAAVRTGGGLWGNYGEALTDERARDSSFREENPIAAGVANIAGAVAGPGRALGTMRAAGYGANLLARVGRSALSRGAVAGATGGALAGAGEGEGIDGRLAGAAGGAALGGLGGAVIGGGLSAGSGLAGRLLNMTGMRNADTAADRQILRAFERDQIDPSTLLRPQQGPEALVDMAGRNTVNLGALAANTPGRGVEVADAFTQTRRGARPDRIAAAVDDGFGGGGGTRVADEVAALQQQRVTNAAPLYARTFGQRVPNTVQDRIEPVVSSREGQDALNRAVVIMEREGREQFLRSGNRDDLFDPESMGLTRADGGQWALEGRVQNMRLVDAIKRGMDDMLEEYRDPVTLRLPNTEAVRALNGQRAAYVEYLRGHPHLQPYARALDAWAGPSQSMDAINQGRAALRTDPDILAGIASRMTPNNMDFLRLGAGRAVTDLASNPARAPSLARSLVEDRLMQRRLEALIPDPAQRAQFTGAMQREGQMAAVENAVSPRAGPHTARLQFGAEDMQNDAPGGMVISMLQAAQHGGLTGAAARGASALYRLGQGINSNTADSLASRLLSPDPVQNAETVRRILAQRRVDEIARARGAAMSGNVYRGIGTAVGLEAND